ncbi:DUF397 domain-containing protein [Streptomyces sp. NPDC059567]
MCPRLSARGAEGVHVRDSKVTEGPRLAFAPRAWVGFVSYVTQR